MLLPVEIILDYYDKLRLANFPVQEDDSASIALLNKAQDELARRTQCVERNHLTALAAYARESGTLTTSADTTTFTWTSASSSTNDYYNGWKFVNVTLGKEGYVVDYVGATNTFTVTPAFTGMAASDDFYIENTENSVALPQDFIGEFFVFFDNQLLERSTRNEILLLDSGTPNASAKPYCYYIYRNSMYLYPRPSGGGEFRIWYYAKPRYAYVDVVQTNESAADELTLPEEVRTGWPAYRINGNSVYVSSGTYANTTVEIVSYAPSTGLCLFYPVLGGVLSADDDYNVLLDVPEDYQDGLINYMMAETFLMRPNYGELAQFYMAKWNEFVEDVRRKCNRRIMQKVPKMRAKRRGGRDEYRGTITG